MKTGSDILVRPPGRAFWRGGSARCAIGRGGIGRKAAEGDGMTPIGRFPLRSVLYRAGRVIRPACPFPCRSIGKNDGWCDDPASPDYNRLVSLPHPARHENLWRDDSLYDIVVVVGFNDDPAVPGLGSAIFIHVARPDYGPTEGCIALARDDLITLLTACGADTFVKIEETPA